MPSNAILRICRSICLIALCSLSINAHSQSLDEARAFYLKGDFSAAIQLYRSFIQQDSKNEQAHIGLIRGLLKKDDIEEAYKSAETALALFPENASLLTVTGDVLFRLARVPEAQKSYTKAISLEPLNARGYWGLGQILHMDFNRKSSKKMIQKAYECDSEDPDIIVDYAQYLPPKEQMPLLEKYLSLATYETEEKRNAIADQIEYIKENGDLKSWQLKDPPQTATIPLKPLPAFGSSFASTRSGYVVKVTINNEKTVDLHLDTGARGILIPRKLAKKLKLKIIGSHHIKGIGDSGSREGYLALAPSVRIGPVEFVNCVLNVMDKQPRPQTEGLIGVSVFSQYLTTMNLPQNKLELNPLPLIRGNPFTDPESWTELDRTRCPELASFSPMGIWGHLIIPTTINNKKSGYFILDTGSAMNVIGRKFAAGVAPLKNAGRVIRGLSGDTDTFIVQDITLTMGRFRQRHDYMYVISLKQLSHDMGFEISGMLGHPLLSQLSITLDYRDGFINFEYPGEKKHR
jgi:tetratricopeptide (TPR) repeat protein